jgi:hypothetical protein
LRRRRRRVGSGEHSWRMNENGRRKSARSKIGGDPWIGGRRIQGPQLKILIGCRVGRGGIRGERKRRVWRVHKLGQRRET